MASRDGISSLLPQLRSLLYAQRLPIVLGLLCSAGAAVVGAAYAYLTGPLLQTLLSGGTQGALAFRAFVPRLLRWRWEGTTALVGVAVVLVLLAALKGVLNLLQTALLEGANQRMGHAFRRDLYRSMLGQPLVAHRRFAVGDLLARFVDDTARVQQALIDAPLTLMREGLAAVALLAVALYLAPGLALVALLAVPLIGWFVGRLSRRVRTAAQGAQSSLGQLAARAQQALSGLRDVKAADAVEREVGELSDISACLARSSTRRALLRAVSPLVNEVTAAAAIGLTIICAGASQVGQAIGPSDLVSFFAAILLMYRPLKGISNAVQLVAASGASASRITEMIGFVAEREPIARDPLQPALTPLRREVVLEEICFRYPGQPLLLDRLSLRVAVGEIVALCGRSGSGKSSVIDLLCGLEQAEAGHLLWDGQPLAPAQCRRLPRQVGLVSQRPLLFDGSVANNLRYGNPTATDAELDQALRAVGLHEEVCAMPEGVGTFLGSAGRGLSVGQAQRLVIARALLRRVRLMLFDEPASALDVEATLRLATTLRALRRSCAILLVSHRRELLACADRSLLLTDGRIEQAGVLEVPAAAKVQVRA